MTPTFPAYKKDGRLIIQNRTAFDVHVETLPDSNLIVTVGKRNSRHSRPQENYRWGVVYPCILQGLIDTGWGKWTKNELHAFLAEKFIKGMKNNLTTGEYIDYTRSSTTLSKEEEMVFLDRITLWASEFLGLTIPQPGQQTEAEF